MKEEDHVNANLVLRALRASVAGGVLALHAVSGPATRAAPSPLLSSAEISAGEVTVRWQARRGMSISYRGVEAFSAYADEFTVHNRAWTVAPYRTREGSSRGSVTSAGEARVLTIRDADQHFSYTKTVAVRPDNSLLVELSYRQTGLSDAALQLGWRPSVGWLSGAAYKTVDGGVTAEGRLTTGHSATPILWSALSHMSFSSPAGRLTMTSTYPMTLYDHRDRGQFWLGWDHVLQAGETVEETVEIRFEPYADQVEGVAITGLTWSREVQDGRLRVSVGLARTPEGPTDLVTRLQCRRGDELAGEASVPVTLTPKPQPVAFRLALATGGAYSATVDLLRQGESTPLHSLGPLHVAVSPTLRFYSSLSLYTTESTVELVATVAEPVVLGKLRLRVDGENGTLTDVDVQTRQCRLSVPAAELPGGLNRLEAYLISDQEVIGSAVTRFCKAPPKPNEVKIDRRTRGLIVDGKPFFPFGFYVHKGRFYDDPDLPRYVLDLEAPHKFNLICPYHNFGVPFRTQARDGIRAFLDRADAVGLKVHYDIRNMCCAEPSQETRAAIADDIRAHRDAPALLCWYLADEPAGQRIPPDRFVDLYAKLKEWDPHHPATMVFCVPNKAHEYLAAMDILMVDPYPIPNGPVTQVADTVDLVRNAAGPGMPVWFVPQAFGGGEGWGREPTPQEERCMTYLAIVHGATGIQYFIRRPPMNNPFVGALWGEIRKMACEIRELTPVLLSPEPPPEVTSVPADPSLHTVARRHQGMAYVVCVNTEKRPRPMTLRCTAPPYGDEAAVLFEDRGVPVSTEGVIEDMIDSFGVRVYSYPTTHPAEPAPRRENLLKNGSFEQQTNVGYPDYFRVGQGKDVAGSWGTDSGEAAQGFHSLFVRCPTAGQGLSVTSYPMVLGPGAYRVSLQMKADRGGLEATISVGGGKEPASAEHLVDTAWSRASLDFIGPDEKRRVHLTLRADTRGVLWVDDASVVAVAGEEPE